MEEETMTREDLNLDMDNEEEEGYCTVKSPTKQNKNGNSEDQKRNVLPKKRSSSSSSSVQSIVEDIETKLSKSKDHLDDPRGADTAKKPDQNNRIKLLRSARDCHGIDADREDEPSPVLIPDDTIRAISPSSQYSASNDSLFGASPRDKNKVGETGMFRQLFRSPSGEFPRHHDPSMSLDKLSQLISPDSRPEENEEAKQQDEPKWQLQYTEEGHAYWHNQSTGESIWANQDREKNSGDDLREDFIKALHGEPQLLGRFLTNCEDLNGLLQLEDRSEAKPVLHWLAIYGLSNELRKTLEYGADPNALDSHRRTALHNCTLDLTSGSAGTTAQILISHGTQPEALDDTGNNVLHYAAMSSKLNDVLKVVVDYFDERQMSKCFQNGAGETPLHSAARAGNLEALLFLLRNCSSDLIEAKSYADGLTAKDLAAACGNSGCVELIESAKRQTELQRKVRNLTAENANLKAALFEKQKQHARTQAERLQHGENGNWELAYTEQGHAYYYNPLTGETRWTTDGGSALVVHEESKGDAGNEHSQKNSPMVGEVWTRFFENALRAQSSDIKAEDQGLEFELEQAIQEMNVDATLQALASGASASHFPSKVSLLPPLQMCCSIAHANSVDAKQRLVQIAQALVEYGADVDALDAQARSPLHIASHIGNSSLVEFLLQHAATVNCADANGDTPLHAAACGETRSHLKCVKLLAKYGASLVWCNSQGQTAVDCARMKMVMAERPTRPLCQIVNLLQQLVFASKEWDLRYEGNDPAVTLARNKDTIASTSHPSFSNELGSDHNQGTSWWSKIPNVLWTGRYDGEHRVEAASYGQHAQPPVPPPLSLQNALGQAQKSTTSLLSAISDEDEDKELQPPPDVLRALEKAKLEKTYRGGETP